jgi:hypothetical protein
VQMWAGGLKQARGCEGGDGEGRGRGGGGGHVSTWPSSNMFRCSELSRLIFSEAPQTGRGRGNPARGWIRLLADPSQQGGWPLGAIPCQSGSGTRCHKGSSGPGNDAAAASPASGADVARGERSPGADLTADLTGVSPVPVQVWPGEPSPGADEAGVSPAPVQMWPE